MRCIPLLIAAISVLAATACGDSSTPKRGTLSTLRLHTAAPSPDDIAYNAGFDDYIADLNAHGGIDGYTIAVDDVALGDDPAQFAAAVTAAKAAHTGGAIVSVFAVDNSDTIGVLPAVDGNTIITTRADDPTLCVPNGVTQTVTLPAGQLSPGGTNPTTVTAPAARNVFHVGLDAGTAARLAIREIDTHGAHRVSFAVCATPATGCANGVLAAKAAASDAGLILGDDLVLASTADTVPAAVNAYLDTHPLGANDWIWVGDNPSVAAALTATLVAYAAAHSDYAPVRVMVDARAFGEPFRDACGAACAGVVMGLEPFAPFGDARPFLMSEVSNVYAEMHPGDPSLQTTRYVEGFANAASWVRAVHGLAAPNLPIIAANLRNSEEVGTPRSVGGLMPDKTFTLTDHRALHESEVFGIDDNGLLSYMDAVSIDLTPETLGY